MAIQFIPTPENTLGTDFLNLVLSLDERKHRRSFEKQELDRMKAVDKALGVHRAEVRGLSREQLTEQKRRNVALEALQAAELRFGEKKFNSDLEALGVKQKYTEALTRQAEANADALTSDAKKELEALSVKLRQQEVVEGGLNTELLRGKLNVLNDLGNGTESEQALLRDFHTNNIRSRRMANELAAMSNRIKQNTLEFNQRIGLMGMRLKQSQEDRASADAFFSLLINRDVFEKAVGKKDTDSIIDSQIKNVGNKFGLEKKKNTLQKDEPDIGFGLGAVSFGLGVDKGALTFNEALVKWQEGDIVSDTAMWKDWSQELSEQGYDLVGNKIVPPTPTNNQDPLGLR